MKNKGMSPAGLRKTVLCPMCGTHMKKVKTKPHQHRREEETGKILKVSRVFYGCPKTECATVIWFDYREDGKRGRLSKILELQKKFGVSPGGLSLTGSVKDLT
jgi:hypothetical protein